MEKNEYIRIIKRNIKIPKSLKQKFYHQIDNFYQYKEIKIKHKEYKIGDRVFLKKGTLLHGTYKNIEGLESIIETGLISSWFIDGRYSKYPGSIGVWNLKKITILTNILISIVEELLLIKILREK